MAANNQQFKIAKLAKDLGVKSKDLVEILSNNGIEAKTTQKALEPAEFDVLLEVLTRSHQITDIGSYLAGETYIPSKVKKTAPAKKAEKPAEVPEVKVEEPKKAAPAPEVKVEEPKKAAPAPEVKAEEPQKPAAAKEAAKPAPEVKAEAERPAETRPQNGAPESTAAAAKPAAPAIPPVKRHRPRVSPIPAIRTVRSRTALHRIRRPPQQAHVPLQAMDRHPLRDPHPHRDLLPQAALAAMRRILAWEAALAVTVRRTVCPAEITEITEITETEADVPTDPIAAATVASTAAATRATSCRMHREKPSRLSPSCAVLRPI